MRSAGALLAALDRSPRALPALALATTLASAVGLAARVPFLLAILQALAAYPFFLAAVRAGAPVRAAARVLVFAAAASATVTAAVLALGPDAVDRAVPYGRAYTDSMVEFVRSGGRAGEEADPSRFLPRHALHLGLFSALAAATAGFGALLMGAFLLDYMSFYVGSLSVLARAGGDPLRALAFGWSPYALVRVAAYSILGSGLAVLVAGPRASRRRALAAVAAGVALAVADVVLKAILARPYGSALLHAVTDPRSP